MTPLQRYRVKHREAGLCLFCAEPAAPGRLRCPYHLAKDYVSTRTYRKNHPENIYERNKRWRAKFKIEGRCQKCGLHLHPEMDGECVTCLNCREGLFCS